MAKEKKNQKFFPVELRLDARLSFRPGIVINYQELEEAINTLKKAIEKITGVKSGKELVRWLNKNFGSLFSDSRGRHPSANKKGKQAK